MAYGGTSPQPKPGEYGYQQQPPPGSYGYQPPVAPGTYQGVDTQKPDKTPTSTIQYGGASNPHMPAPPAAAPPNPWDWTPQSTPGYAEQYYMDNADKWQQMGAPGQYWEGVKGQFAPDAMHSLWGTGSGKSYAEDYLTGGGAGEGLDALYGRLTSEAGRHLNDQAAAAGGYSGAALRANQEMQLGMNANHARDMQAAVGAADSGSAARNGMMQSMLGLGGNLATGAGNDALSRLTGGMNAASAAQAAQQGRERSVLDNLIAVHGPMANATAAANGAARNEQTNLQMEQITAYLQRQGLSAAQAQAQVAQYMQVLGLGTQFALYNALNKTPGAAPAPAATPTGNPNYDPSQDLEGD